jgi:hypothetical protein
MPHGTLSSKFLVSEGVGEMTVLRLVFCAVPRLSPAFEQRAPYRNEPDFVWVRSNMLTCSNESLHNVGESLFVSLSWDWIRPMTRSRKAKLIGQQFCRTLSSPWGGGTFTSLERIRLIQPGRCMLSSGCDPHIWLDAVIVRQYSTQVLDLSSLTVSMGSPITKSVSPLPRTVHPPQISLS